MRGTPSCRSIVIAGHTGDRTTVENALSADDAGARAAALGAAVRLGLLDADGLIDFLADESLDVRYRALELLPRIEDGAEGADAVTSMLADPDVAELAAFVLGELSPQGPSLPRAVAALSRQALDHDDALCREAAVAALGALGHGLPAILAACEDIATVRRRAVLALAPFDGPDVDRALDNALNDRDWQVRQAAEDLLSIGDAEEPQA